MQLTHLKLSNLTQGAEGHVILARCMKGENWQNNNRKLWNLCLSTTSVSNKGHLNIVCCLFLVSTTFREYWYESQL